MKLGTHMPGGERRKPINIEDCNTKVKVTTSKNRTKIWYFFCFRIISKERNVGSKWNLVHTCRMVTGWNLLILRFVEQRSRSQLLKIEQKLDNCFASARYLKKEMSDLSESWYTGIVHPYVRNSAFAPLVRYWFFCKLTQNANLETLLWPMVTLFHLNSVARRTRQQ